MGWAGGGLVGLQGGPRGSNGLVWLTLLWAENVKRPKFH